MKTYLSDERFKETYQKILTLKKVGMNEKEILKRFDILENDFLIPDDYLPLLLLYSEQMNKITNGCKPGYIPGFIKVEHCEKRKKCCNFHDFLYWIAWYRKESDKIFLSEMKQACKGFKNNLRNYEFYFLVRSFGLTAMEKERKTINDFLNI